MEKRKVSHQSCQAEDKPNTPWIWSSSRGYTIGLSTLSKLLHAHTHPKRTGVDERFAFALLLCDLFEVSHTDPEAFEDSSAAEVAQRLKDLEVVDVEPDSGMGMQHSCTCTSK